MAIALKDKQMEEVVRHLIEQLRPRVCAWHLLTEIQKESQIFHSFGGSDRDGNTGPTKKEPAFIPIAEGIQPLASKVVNKIDSSEFVDLGDLLQDQIPHDELTLPDLKSGVVLVQSLESLKKKRITDFQSWVEGGLHSVVVTKFRTLQPEVANLMAYKVLINQTAREHAPD
uniref:Uncharacterized protein n=1 Tax=Amphimedon queenslandica TaxID=400682 RepID=A0A1X7T4X9_AMPQE